MKCSKASDTRRTEDVWTTEELSSEPCGMQSPESSVKPQDSGNQENASETEQKTEELPQLEGADLDTLVDIFLLLKEWDEELQSESK